MQYKIILFDADGVTLQDEGLFTDKAKEKGLISSTDKTVPFFKGVFQNCLVGKADLKEELAKVIGDWGWKGTVDEIIEFWFSVGDDIDPRIKNFINNLKQKGVSVYMTADQERYRAQYLRNKISRLFDDFFFSGEVGHTKKEPEFFEYVYNKVRDKVSNKSEIFFVDDALHNVENARAFGIDAVHYHTFDDLKNYANR